MAFISGFLHSVWIIVLACLSVLVGQVLSHCGCNTVGSVSSACTLDGKCICKPKFYGPKCDQLETGHYIPSVESMLYDAQDAILSPPQEKVINYTVISTATEKRTLAVGLVLRAGVTVFVPTELRFLIQVPRTGRYTFVLRYRLSFSWKILSLEVMLRTFFKPFTCDNITNHTSNELIIFASNATTEADYLLFGEKCLLKGMYQAVLQIPRDLEMSVEKYIIIDSLLVLPSIKHYSPYQTASQSEKEKMSRYYKDAFSIRTWAASSEIGNEVLAPIYWYLYETKACSCDPRGSKFSTCAKYGGQCTCLHNFMGRSCAACRPDLRYNKTTGEPGCHTCDCNNHSDNCQFSTEAKEGKCVNCSHNTMGANCERCKPGYYHNSSIPFNHPLACTECNCNTESGSVSSICDSVTGQCPCKDLVEGRTCDTCVRGFWKLNALGAKSCEEKDVCKPQLAKVKALESEVNLFKILMIVFAVLLGITIILVAVCCFRLKNSGEDYSLTVEQRNINYGYDAFEMSPKKNVENPYYSDPSLSSGLKSFGRS